jgi:hypothetical protein
MGIEIGCIINGTKHYCSSCIHPYLNGKCDTQKIEFEEVEKQER